MGATSSSQDKHILPRTSPLNRFSYTHTLGDSDISQKEQRKKKSSKFATLRKKLTRVRRQSRSLDYGRVMREFLSTWSVKDLLCLVGQYEASSTLKELSIAADLARPPVNSIRQDLSDLFYYKHCTDIDLIYKSICFPAHRAFLCARSPFFRQLLMHYPLHKSQIPVTFKTPGVNVELFATVLRYLYTDELVTEESRLYNEEVLFQLAEEVGLPNPLEQDLQHLLESGLYADAVLVFTNDNDCADTSFNSDDAGTSEMTRSCRVIKYELLCHQAILAARSPFFRSLIIRRSRSGEENPEQTLFTPSRIILDDNVISRRYARVLLNAIYNDSVDLNHILKGSPSMCSLSEVQAMVAGKSVMNPLDEAMEIYQIGQFLDLPVLSQGCEDIIAESINQESLISILNWSSEAHGSPWVHRQVLHYLREEFNQYSISPILYELSKDCLIEIFRSDFLQAGECDVLNVVLRWGEHQLIKRIEESEPNLLTHTTHSISKKGVKRRDMRDDDLRDVLRDILPLVRIDHVLPQSSDTLSSALKRGLFSMPPSHLIGDDIVEDSPVNSWLRLKSTGLFMSPRLFMPYFEEAKNVLEERLQHNSDQECSQGHLKSMSYVPDTLYMVDDKYSCQTFMPFIPTSTATVDIIAGTIPVPDKSTLVMMLHREKELQRSKTAQRATNLSYCDRRAIAHQIQVRVVREFGLPDSTVEILKNSQYYCPDETQYIDRMYTLSVGPNNSPSPPITSSSCTPVENNSIHSDSALSEVIPDIAMATTSAQNREEFELDIGNRNSRHGSLFV